MRAHPRRGMLCTMTDLDALVSRLEIDDLLTRYSTAIDSGKWDLLDEVFSADAHIDYRSAGGIAGGFAEVKAWLAQVLPGLDASQHYVMNRDVRIAGDTATARSMFLNINRSRPDSEAGFWCGGYYEDRLERRPEGWRIVRRIEDTVWWRDPPDPSVPVPPGIFPDVARDF
jgi:hypothetical protein